MNLMLSSAQGQRGKLRKSAFTMVEIALALAIIGFALVAIIGVLPAGLNVQKNNRQETIVTQDANYFMEAIRNGARGLDDLTNYVISITNYWTIYDTNVPLNQPWVFKQSGIDGYTRYQSSRTSYAPAINDFPLDTGFDIIGLLSRLKFEPVKLTTDFGAIDLTTINYIRSNHIVALFRAISGAASEKYPQTNALVQDLAFSYRMVPEVFVLPQAEIITNGIVDPVVLKELQQAQEFSVQLQNRLREVRLKFAWPLLPRNNLGNGRQTFRTMTGGTLPSQLVTNNAQLVYFFNPTAY